MTNEIDPILPAGTVIQEKWVILEFIAKGGMGEVYRAHQLNLKRDVAIKIISREWLESVEDDAEEREMGLRRFENEVHAMAQVRHPNILQIYDYGKCTVRKGVESLDLEYIALEYVPGGTLRSTMSDDGFYAEEDLTREWLNIFFLRVLDGVKALHEAGIIHRDLKPGNIFMDGKIPKIADFGLARSSLIRPVTQSIDVKGTPQYMSPDQFYDLRRTDQRADIYSLGKILYEAVDGRMGPKVIPFKQARLAKAETVFFRKIDRLIQVATSEDKNERLESVEEMRKAILDILAAKDSGAEAETQERRKRFAFLTRPVWIWGGISVTLLALVIMTIWHLSGEPGISIEKREKPLEAPRGSLAEKTLEAIPPSPEPGWTLIGLDESPLHFIPGGSYTFSESFGDQSGKTIPVPPFFIDETEVTNHQFVDFLNRNLPRIKVENNVVKGDGKLWLLLGEVSEGYEPIRFRDGGFKVERPAYHSNPLVRVTAYGATAYASYYGRRLPTLAEWHRAAAEGQHPKKETVNQETVTRPSHMMDHMEEIQDQAPIPQTSQSEKVSKILSVSQLIPDRLGVRGLEGNAAEWVMISREEGEQQGVEFLRYVILPGAVSRNPWEAESTIGFRTVLPFRKQGDSS